jgi:large subunit ribosomal protein L23
MSVLYKPLITEKATSESELSNQYTFLVRTNANKIEIKKAVELKYGVSVEKVRTINYRPDRKKKYTKNGIQNSKSNITKRAIVQLVEGDNIDFYNNI